MKPPDQLKAEALSAIQALRTMAVLGDEQEATDATAALLEITNRGISQVESLGNHPAGRPAPDALSRFAASASSWPVRVPSIEEMRENSIKVQLPPTFGDMSPIKTEANKRGRSRNFSPHSRTGFALAVVNDLMADGEFPMGGDKDDLLIACLEKLEEDCAGDWDRFPWPPKLREDATADARSIKSTVGKWLKDGLRKLCR